LGVPGILILVEPDLGTTLVYLVSVGMILFVSKIKWYQLFTLFGIAIVGLFLSWNLVFRDYQKQRILSFVSPDSGNNYNARQALIAVGSGQFFRQRLGFWLSITS
jgi:rod shape determining protein RodA